MPRTTSNKQTPLRGQLLRTIAKYDRSDRFRTASADYWLAELGTPLSWTRDGVTRAIRHLVLAARWEGTSIQPGATLPVGIACVVDDSLLSSESFDLTQAEYIANGMAKVETSRWPGGGPCWLLLERGRPLSDLR
jgi:hypothetical protein